MIIAIYVYDEFEFYTLRASMFNLSVPVINPKKMTPQNAIPIYTAFAYLDDGFERYG